MNKIIILVVMIVIALIGGGYLLTAKDNQTTDTHSSSSGSNNKLSSTGKKACELLTLDDAKSLIGKNATITPGADTPSLANSESVNIDNCTYSADGATLGDLKQITIQRQFGDRNHVKQAYENYKKEFPGEAVEGLGDTAYYVTGSEQVQVLKGDYWLHVAGGSINAGDAANKELVIKAAKTALEKL